MYTIIIEENNQNARGNGYIFLLNITINEGFFATQISWQQCLQ